MERCCSGSVTTVSGTTMKTRRHLRSVSDSCNVRREATPTVMGNDEFAWAVLESTGGLPVRWHRECTPGAGISAPVQRASNRLVPYHDAGDCVPAADEGIAGGAA